MPFAAKGRWALWLTALFSSLVLAQDRLSLCAACHGADGNSTNAGVPSIAGQPETFLETQLILFRVGVRQSDQMASVVQGMTDAEATRIARHFAALPARPAPAGPDNAALMARGAELARQKRCGVCHLPDFRGQAQIPALAGQREDYLAQELAAYRSDRRVGSDTSMNEVMYGLSDDDLRALAHFLSRAATPAPARPATKGPSAAPR